MDDFCGRDAELFVDGGSQLFVAKRETRLSWMPFATEYLSMRWLAKLLHKVGVVDGEFPWFIQQFEKPLAAQTLVDRGNGTV